MANYVLDHTGQQVNTKLTKAENTDNKVTSISSSSTNTQYPSAKLLYDQLALKQNSSSAFSGDYNDLTNKPTIPDVGNAKIYYGTCTTAADVAEKQVVCAAYTTTGNPTKGDIIYVTFSYTNSVAAGTAKLKVGNSTAKVIRYQGTTSVTNLPGANYLLANNTYRFTYNGTYWVVMLNYNSNTNTLQRTFVSDTNIELPLMGVSGAASATATIPAFSSGTDPNFYTDSYGAIPATGNLRATINPSTGAITAPGGFVGNLTGVAATASSVAWSGITNKPTTLSGYGITDASIFNGTITLGNNTITPLTSHQDISGKQDNRPNGTNLLIDNSTGKINTTYIPDSLLGQVIFGGIITGKGESDGPDGQEIIVTLSATAKSILKVSSNTTTIGEEEQLVSYDKMFFINNLSDSNFIFANLILNTGDWLINLSGSWQKVDNTDAVTSVNGKVGNITLKISDLQNDSGYLTSHQSLTNYYNKTDVNNLLDGKANTNHTHSQYLTSHQDISGKEDKSNRVYSFIFTGEGEEDENGNIIIYNHDNYYPTVGAVESYISSQHFLTNQDISGKENSSNKVTSISSSSTDTQYPSAKLLYDQLVLKAPLASPSLTGTPTAPTATAGTNTTQIATTAFVNTAISGKQDKLSQGNSQEFVDTDNTGVMKRSGYKITTNKNVITDRDSAEAFIPNARAIAQAVFASPAFTGTPTAPTAASGTDTTQIATTAFVQSEISDKQKQHITLTLTLNASNWNNHSLTVTATGVTASNTIIISYPIDSLQTAVDSQIYCSNQGTNSLTFTCIGQAPIDNITANVLILPN